MALPVRGLQRGHQHERAAHLPDDEGAAADAWRSTCPLDFIPTDYVVAGMILALAELLEGTARPVYQLGASDVNPCTAQRFGELVGLYKRKHYQRKGGNPLLNALQARFEPTFVDRSDVLDAAARRPSRTRRAQLASLVKKAVPALAPAAKALDGVAEDRGEDRRDPGASSSRSRRSMQRALRLLEHARRVRAPRRRRPGEAAAGRPRRIDWADWMMQRPHAGDGEADPARDGPEARRGSPRRSRAHATLVSLVDEMAERHDLGARAPAR